MQKLLFIVFTIFAAIPVSLLTVQSQSKKSIASDCIEAIKIPIDKNRPYGPTDAPNGPGEKEEIKSNQKNDPFSFEKEHNSAWYYFDVTANGLLSLKIAPIKSNDDYDFLLFKYTDSCFCDNLTKKKIMPVRSNISRTGLGGSEITGMSKQSINEFVHDGAGDKFSKSLSVKTGERYYLVLDNVYPAGDGHTIELGFERETCISGVVLNELNKPIKAEVTLEDKNGNELAKTFSDEKTGKYEFFVSVQANKNYYITYVADSSFIETREITTEYLVRDNYKINDIKSILPELKGGKKYTLNGINFWPESSVLIPKSLSSMKALYKLMKKNPRMIIRIEGHVNNAGAGGKFETLSEDFAKKLSEQRAKTVYDSLIQKGIDKERMSTIGFGMKYMLIPNPKSEEEKWKNMRVEINVISL